MQDSVSIISQHKQSIYFVQQPTFAMAMNASTTSWSSVCKILSVYPIPTSKPDTRKTHLSLQGRPFYRRLDLCFWKLLALLRFVSPSWPQSRRVPSPDFAHPLRQQQPRQHCVNPNFRSLCLSKALHQMQPLKHETLAPSLSLQKFKNPSTYLQPSRPSMPCYSLPATFPVAVFYQSDITFLPHLCRHMAVARAETHRSRAREDQLASIRILLEVRQRGLQKVQRGFGVDGPALLRHASAPLGLQSYQSPPNSSHISSTNEARN